MPTPSSDPEAAIVRFGDAEFDRRIQALSVAGKRAPLGPRALALLGALLDGRDRALSKQELLDTVWRGVIVEENNLQVQISTLRRLLGPQAIATIPGRGYRFMLPIEGSRGPDPSLGQDGPTSDAGTPPHERGNLPASVGILYGRDGEFEALQTLLKSHALVSIVGPAGMGKTRLATAAAMAVSSAHVDGVWVVELAALNDPALLVHTVARALQIVLPGLRDPAEELAAALRGLDALLVMDNCEHLLDEVGTLVAALLRHAPAVRILATTQEPLKVLEENVFRLGPLAIPPDASVPGAAAYGAVQLFVERVRALQARFKLQAENLDDAVEICQRLDGLPLAIELAAARVPLLGVAGVRARLGERFQVLTSGSRTAPKRHQTLRAALDWSHALLTAQEQAVYRRLGTFVGSFSLEAAQELAESDGIDAWAVLDHLGSLVDKSLVIAQGEDRPRYRLLESTREHALQQLSKAGESSRWIARHARVTRRSLEREIRSRRSDLLLAEMGNVRSAYEWALGPSGDPTIAVALATLPSMVLAVEGSAEEARQRLLEVEPLVDETMPPELVAQYWQWHGRIGLDGRLPTSRCIASFQRAERLFDALGSLRHVHACRRHLAEALLNANDFAGAAAALERARAMETPRWPLADRVRRLRVEGLLLARSHRADEALRAASLALEMAQKGTIDRYELVLLDDIARLHLDAGDAHEAAARFRTLAERARHAPNGGLTLSNALSGLIAALTAEARLDDAVAVATASLPVLRRSGILLARSDILACLAARRGFPELAARLLGASDSFRAGCETVRDAIEERCRAQARAAVSHSLSDEARVAWMAAGASETESEIADAITALSAAGAAQTVAAA